MFKTISDFQDYIRAGKLGKHVSPNLEMVLFASSSIDMTVKIVSIYVGNKIAVKDQDFLNALFYKSIKDKYAHPQTILTMANMIPGFNMAGNVEMFIDIISEVDRLAGGYSSKHPPMNYHVPRVSDGIRRAGSIVRVFEKDVIATEREINKLRIEKSNSNLTIRTMEVLLREQAIALKQNNLVHDLDDPMFPRARLDKYITAPA